MLLKADKIAMLLYLGMALLTAAFSKDARAEVATSQFSIRLVIAPPCNGGASPSVPDVRDARDLAVGYLGLPADLMDVDHDIVNTGYWLVRVKDDAVLRISKCTGELSPAQEADLLPDPISNPTKELTQR